MNRAMRRATKSNLLHQKHESYATSAAEVAAAGFTESEAVNAVSILHGATNPSVGERVSGAVDVLFDDPTFSTRLLKTLEAVTISLVRSGPFHEALKAKLENEIEVRLIEVLGERRAEFDQRVKEIVEERWEEHVQATAKKALHEHGERLLRRILGA